MTATRRTGARLSGSNSAGSRSPGANVLGRWTRALANGSELRVQSYLDHAERDDALFFRPRRDTFDVEIQHGVERGAHDLIWGGGYRRTVTSRHGIHHDVHTGEPRSRVGQRVPTRPHSTARESRSDARLEARAQRLHGHGVVAERAAGLATVRRPAHLGCGVTRRARAVAHRPRRFFPGRARLSS